jgi:hypothetical protein
MRSNPPSWTSLLSKLGFTHKKRRPYTKAGYCRTLSFEGFEDRRMLATFVVTSSADAIVNTPAAVGTLRQAIQNANN